MSKYGDSIRRISKYEQLIKLIKKAQQTADQALKNAIEGTRSIAYLNAQSVAATAVKSALGVAKPTLTGVNNPTGTPLSTGLSQGQSGAVSAANPSAGLTNNGASGDLNSGDNTDKEGWYDAKSILDGAKDAANKVPPVPGSGQTVQSITGLAAAAGRNIVVHLKDAGSAFVPSDNFSEGPFIRPIDSSYEPGKVWAILSGITVLYANSFSGVVSAVESFTVTKAYNYTGGVVAGNPSVGSPLLFSSNFTAPLGSTPGGTVYNYQAYVSGATVTAGKYQIQDCGLSVGDVVACNASPPLQPTWDDLLVTQLAWASPITPALQPLIPYALMGRFIPNPFDVYVPTEYQNGASILDLQTLTGDEVRIGPLREGGWYMYYRDPLNSNLPVGSAGANSVYIINSAKLPQGFITPNQLSTMLPI